MSKLLSLFQGKKHVIPPIWLMRQAGRYLPEYQDIRKKNPNFWERCFSPELAMEITLQPLRRFDFDAAILFSDILVIPYALGQEVVFKEGEGPLLSSLTLSSFQNQLSREGFLEKLAPVYEALRLTRAQLSPSKALLGFTGAPWTLALYMLEGRGSRDFSEAKTQAFQQEEDFSQLLTLLSEAVACHLGEQVKAGAQALQIFDTWAGHCPASHFEKWVIEPTRHIVSSLRKTYPDVPIIGFPKGIGLNLLPYAESTRVSALSLDSSTPLSWARKNLPEHLILQGNIDPLLLVTGGDALRGAIHHAVEDMRGKAYIFNLGHGILPQTPLKNVEDCMAWVKECA